DGTGYQIRLQHAMGVALHDGKLYVADTYNSKIKVIDPARRTCATYLGGPDGRADQPLFNEPGGLSCAAGKLYVADTNAHRIRVVDLQTKEVTTLALQGVDPPKLSEEPDRPSLPNPVTALLPPAAVPGDGALTLQVELHLSPGLKLNPLA